MIMNAKTRIDWPKYLKNGGRIFFGSNAGTPHGLIREFLKQVSPYRDLEVVHVLTLGEAPWVGPEYRDHLRTNSLFLGGPVREAVKEGAADYTPCFLSEIPSLFTQQVLPLDLALIQVSPPDAAGYCSLGVAVDIVSAACRSAKSVIAQINPRMPRTLGQSFIHVNEIDAFFEQTEELSEIKPPHLDETTLRIGQYVAQLIRDGSCLQMGIGKIPDAVLNCLTHHNDLGIHTEMFSDGLLSCLEQGVINNKQKNIHRGKTITSFCIGTRRLYDFVHNNPHVEFHPTEYVNDPRVIAKNDRMVAINSAIEVDLTGQVVSDSVGYRFYSGIGGQVDFIRGAAMSHEGIPIIALPSTTKDNTISRIVPFITQGSGVVTSRGDIHYVVTEYGIATLRGRSIRERALELIQIAHPQFRDELLTRVREHFRVPAYQKDKPSVIPEMKGMESQKLKLKDGQDYFLRPIRPSDERRVKEFIHSHSKLTIYQRYRQEIVEMSQERVYDLVNVDQNKDLALCIVERQGPREVVHGVGRYYLASDKKTAEIAFVVRENKRGLGMANLLLQKIIHIARKRQLTRLQSLVLSDNQPMLHILSKLGFVSEPTKNPRELFLKLDL